MYGTLLFLSDKKYKKEKVQQIMQQYCYDYHIPETIYGNFTDEHIQKIITDAQPPEFFVMMAKKKYKETKSEKYKKQLDEYDALLKRDVERYFNLQEGFRAFHGKVYTTKNLINGKYKSISFGNDGDFQKLLTKKSWNYVDVCRKEELAEVSRDSISMLFDYDNNEWYELMQPLVIEDGDDFNYQEAVARAEIAKKVKFEMIEKINNISLERYCYGLIYQI